MPNKRFEKFKGGGAPTGHDGGKHDTVGPIKTKKWPKPPGTATSGKFNHDGKKMHQGLAPKGV